MAERRMFAKSIVLSDAFLDMPMSARCLYFTLGMLADDDGFVGSPKSIMRQCGASKDDMNILLQKRYVLGFESGVIVIKHWRMNNYLQNDRHKPTTYLEELETLSIDNKGAYTEKQGMYTECIQTVYTGKDSIDKNSIDKVSKGKVIYYPNDENLDKAFADYVTMRKKLKKPMTDRAVELAIKKLNDLSKGDNDIAIKIIEQSVMNSWQGLFPLKEEQTNNKSTLFDKWGVTL